MSWVVSTSSPSLCSFSQLVYTLERLYNNYPRTFSRLRQGFSWKMEFFMEREFPTQVDTASTKSFYS